MAYALVGSAGAVASGGNNLQPAFGQATTAGNLLICWFTSDTNAVNQHIPTGWSAATGIGGANSGGDFGVLYKANCGSGETAPTLTWDSVTTVVACLAEFSGGATTSPLDQTKTTAAAGSSPSAVTSAGADVAAGELIIAIQLDGLSKAGTVTTSHTYNNGASAHYVGNNDATSSISHYRFSWGTTTGNSVADSISFADSSMNLSALGGALGSFTLAASGTTYSKAGHGVESG